MITTKDHKDDIISQRALDYTPDGQIKSIKDNDKLIATYQYNHLRQRIAKTTYYKDHQTNQTKEETTQYLWDKGLISAEIKDDKVIRRYVYLDIMPVAVLDYGYDEKGKLNETKVYSIHTDHLGTPKQITDQNQETVWQIDLDTFGETKSIDSKDDFTFNLRFAGQYFDQESGYHYNYHRYYDPKIGRYLTSDPIGLAGGFNSYGYAYNRPMEFVDPLGLLVVAHLNTKTGILTVTDEDTKETVTIKAFSGGKAVNGIITEVGVGKNLPMPRGRYIITNNPGKTSPATWYGLLYLDGRINDIIESNDSNINGRAGFRLHPGTLSHGCTTIDTSIPEGQTNWEKVDSLLKATVKTTVIFEEPWYTKNKLMTKYGVLDVTY